jgi:hypothetical protein
VENVSRCCEPKYAKVFRLNIFSTVLQQWHEAVHRISGDIIPNAKVLAIAFSLYAEQWIGFNYFIDPSRQQSSTVSYSFSMDARSPNVENVSRRCELKYARVFLLNIFPK